MERLILIHSNTCNGELKHLHNRKAFRHSEIVDLEVFQCDKCLEIVDYEVPVEYITSIDLTFMS